MKTKDISIGIAIGLVIAWLFFGRQQTQPTQAISSQQLFYIQDRMDRIEQQLSAQSSRPIPYNQSIPYNQPTPVINAGYKNDEKWIIERGTDGHIKSLQIARDAKVKRLD